MPLASGVPGQSRQRQAVFFGWHVVGAAFIIAVLAWGVGFYGPSVFLGALHHRRGWPVTLISAAVTCHFLVSAGIVSRLPVLHRRFGLVAVTRAGAVFVSLGMLLWALPGEPWQLFPAATLTGAGFAMTGGAAINAMVAPWFESKRPAALALAYNGASVGGMIFAPLWMVLITGLGFAGAAATIGVVTVAMLWPVIGRFLGLAPADLGLTPDGNAEPAGRIVRKSKRNGVRRAPLPPGAGAWGDRRFATLSVAFALGFFAQIGLIVNLVLLTGPTLGQVGAGAAVSLVTACAIVGRTLTGALVPAGADWRMIASANFAMQATGTLALLAAGPGSVPLLLLGCALFGLGVGNLISFHPLIAAAEFVPTDVARVVALVTAGNQATYAFAPVLLGALSDLTAANSGPLAAVALAQMLAATIVLLGRGARSSISPTGSIN